MGLPQGPSKSIMQAQRGPILSGPPNLAQSSFFLSRTDPRETQQPFFISHARHGSPSTCMKPDHVYPPIHFTSTKPRTRSPQHQWTPQNSPHVSYSPMQPTAASHSSAPRLSREWWSTHLAPVKSPSSLTQLHQDSSCTLARQQPHQLDHPSWHPRKEPPLGPYKSHETNEERGWQKLLQ